MKKTLLTAIVFGSFALANATCSWGTVFTFEGTFSDLERPIDLNAEQVAYDADIASGYTGAEVLGSATMDITVADNTVTAKLSNTSALFAPGVTGFGFDLADFDSNPDNDPIAPVFWSLYAYSTVANDAEMILIGGTDATDPDTDYYWNLTAGEKYNGIDIDYISSLGDVKGALYNPAASEGFAADPYYFTDAILTLTYAYDLNPVLDFDADYSPFVRMQNVGLEGEYSLKLGGEPVPEPATMLLFGTGLLALAGRRARRKK